jgi:poly(A) polymerase
MERLSAERVRTEILKLLKAPAPVTTLRWMREDGILARVLPEADDSARLERLVEMERSLGIADPIRRLGALVARGDDAAAALAGRLRLSNRERSRLAAMFTGEAGVDETSGAAAWQRAFYRHGADATADRALLTAAATQAPVPRGLVAAAAAWQRPVFPLTGEDAMALGLAGAAIGEALRAVEAAWIDENFRPGRAELLERLRRWKPDG